MPTIPILHTDRLILRAYTLDDAPAVTRILSKHAYVRHTLRFQHPYPVEMAEDWIRQHNALAERGVHLQSTIALTREGLIGTVSMALQDTLSVGDIGYWSAVHAWNRGYAT